MLNVDQQNRLDELRELAIERREFNLNNPGVSNTTDYDFQIIQDDTEHAELELLAANGDVSTLNEYHRELLFPGTCEDEE